MHHTHYDSLKITRDAPAEVIRAAYRALSLLYHPDRNPDDAQAARNMTLLNDAYAVLSDPEKRREYDESIRSAETAPYSAPPDGTDTPSPGRSVASAFRSSADDSAALEPQDRWRNYAVWSAVAVVAVLAAFGAVALYRAKDVPHPPASLAVAPAETQTTRQSAASEARHLWPSPATGAARPDASSSSAKSSTSADVQPPRTPAATASNSAAKLATQKAAEERSAQKTSQDLSIPKAPQDPLAPKAPQAGSASQAPQDVSAPKAPQEPSAPKRVVQYADTHTHSDTAPNGERWPATSNYVRGYEVLYANGGSQLVIDNSKNNFDVFVKLVALTGNEVKTVRSIFVLAHDQFFARHMRAGTYEARYRQLESGALLRSATFVLDESAIAGGTRYSIVTLEVHGEPDDSVNTYALSEEEFDQ